MKRFVLILSVCVAVNLTAFAQNVPDTHPTASIFAIDYQTGREAEVRYDAAILFKNSLIDLVINTTIARMQLTKVVPGKKIYVITQMDPQTNGNAYQLVLQNQFLGRTTLLYTFVYSVDQNTLSFLDPQSGRYVVATVEGANVNNLNNCANYGTFNVPPPPPQAAAPPQAIAANNPDNTPIDADVSANTAPPAMPDYDQPECPVDGYLWQPGYWGYAPDNSGYYWVPGAWVAPPQTNFLWTPPYWGFDNGLYVFHGGYWGPTIGFYGGINYGFGYYGAGFAGGNWYNGHFRYNTAVVRVNVGVVRNVYVDRNVVVVRESGPHFAFNGRGGVIARPNDREIAAMKEHHVMATPEQIRNQRAAREDRAQFAANNGGRPANVASPRAMEPRPGAGARPGMNGGNNGRPEMNNANNGQQNNGGRPNMNNGGQPNNGNRPNNNSYQPTNNAAAPTQAANAVGQGGRPAGNAPQGGNTPAAAGTNANAQGNRPATGSTPPQNANAPGANQNAQGNRPATGGTPPQNANAPGANQNAQGNRPATNAPSAPNTQGGRPANQQQRQQRPQQQQQQKRTPPPPEKKP